MRVPSGANFVLQLYLLVVIPVLALRTRARHRAAQSGRGPAFPDRARILRSTVVMLLALGALAVMAGREFGYEVFLVPRMGGREIAAGGAAFLATWGVTWLLRRSRSEEEMRRLAIFAWMPQTPGERALFFLTALLAGISEEAAYRGVGWHSLGWTLGDQTVWAALALAVAFGVAHAIQGWKSAVAITVIALIMHLLVWYTETLVVAMVVHAVYDVFAGLRAARMARAYAVP